MADLTEQQLLSTDPEVLGLQRQRQLANLLTGQAFNAPQGQVISGHYVKPSGLQQALPMINAAIGGITNANLDTKQTELATALRGQKAEAFTKFQELMANPATRAEAMKYAAGNQYLQPMAAELMKPQKLGEGENLVMPSIGGGEPVKLAEGGAKYHAPISIDTGNSTVLLDPITKQKIGEFAKAHQPVAGQVVETANGPMLVNTRTGQAQPVMAGGQPLPAALDTKQKNEVSSINQQRSVIDGALKAVKETPNAFSLGRGIAGNMPLGETLAGRTQSADQTAARSYVYNVVSKVINERAGAAQSKQELQRLSSFLPSEYDNAKTIEDKLNGFKGYLSDLEKGARAPVSGQMPQTSQAPQAPKKVVNFNDLP